MQFVVDQASHLLGAGATSMTARLAELHTISLWSLSYVFSLGLMYLFHSPFRAHTASRTDWYAQLTKVMQVWLAVVVVFFHIAPRLLRPEGRYSSGAHRSHDVDPAGSGEGGAAFVFFPVFTTLSMMLLLLHKGKRRLRLGVTYGPSLTVVLLNSILLSVFTLVHYTACWEVTGHVRAALATLRGGVIINDDVAVSRAEETGVWWLSNTVRRSSLTAATAGLRLVCPAHHVLARPFTTIAHLALFNVLFVALDYAYKSHRSFDPTRGILFAEQYNMRKRTSPIAATASGAEAGASTAVGAQALRRPAPSSSWWWSWWWWHLTRNDTRLREAYRAYDARYAEPRPTRVVPRKLQQAQQQRSNGRQSLGRKSSSADAIAPPSLGSPTSPTGHLLSPPSPHLNSTSAVEHVAFPLSTGEIAELVGTGHPDNKAGMVPWFSTFVLGTTWQTAAYGALGFLVFDVRLLQETRRPRMFDLHFHKGLTSLVAARQRRNAAPGACRSAGGSGEERTCSAPQEPAVAASDTTITTTTTITATTRSAARANSADHDREEGDDDDVWFDWIADVGDGFNSTYEMARLVAQPVLHVTAVTSAPPQHRQRKHSQDRQHDKQRQQHYERPPERRCMTPPGSPSSSHSAANTYHLPRGSFLVIGGDLAYPNPCDETFLTRLVGPYNDALRGHRCMQELLNAQRNELVEADPLDDDCAHVHVLSASSVAAITSATGTRDSRRQSCRGRGTVAEAVRSVPLLFAIPGNHEWLDGLTTFRKFILERTWVGGWFVPQRTSYFTLKLPHNWFILCTDCGTQKDVDPTQLNYFLGVVESQMDAESCVVLTSHEPGWIYDAMLRRDQATQPELNRLAMALGTRLRMWLAGDIHHYSRHTPRDPASEAPQLVVSGGGGAFLHGPRRSAVIHQGTEYVRAAAFPHSNTYMTLLSRLIGFRLINWKFDLVVGAGCFVMVLSMLPQPYGTARMEDIRDIRDFASAWADLTGALIEYIFVNGVVSLVAVFGFFSGFASAGGGNGVPPVLRLVHGAFWTSLVVLSCCGMLAYLECVLGYMANNDMLLSAGGRWGCELDEEVRLAADALLNHTWRVLGEGTRAVRGLQAAQHRLYGSRLVRLCGVLLRCLDPVETLAYLSVKVSSPELNMGKTSPDATRTEVVLYYCNFLFFYWLLVTPLVSFLIGSFLLVSATLFDCFYDPAYSAFQIEDYKHFVRFRIDARTRQLHGYVVAEKKVPKVWQLDSQHVDEACGRTVVGGASAMAPPHLWRYPSRWRSSVSPDIDPDITTVGERLFSFLHRGPPRRAAVRGKPEILEHFVCRPHSVDKVKTESVPPAVSGSGIT